MSEERITTKIYLTDHTILNFLIDLESMTKQNELRKQKKVYQFVIKSLNSVILYLSFEISNKI